MNSVPRSLSAIRFSISERDTLEWASVLDDDNPLHSDPAAIAAHGIGRGIVSPGPANIGFLMTFLLRHFPGAEIESFEARFTGVVLAPSEVEACGVIEREERTRNHEILHCTLELHESSAIVVTAKARIRVASIGRRDSP